MIVKLSQWFLMLFDDFDLCRAASWSHHYAVRCPEMPLKEAKRSAHQKSQP